MQKTEYGSKMNSKVGSETVLGDFELRIGLRMN